MKNFVKAFFDNVTMSKSPLPKEEKVSLIKEYKLAIDECREYNWDDERMDKADLIWSKMSELDRRIAKEDLSIDV